MRRFFTWAAITFVLATGIVDSSDLKALNTPTYNLKALISSGAEQPSPMRATQFSVATGASVSRPNVLRQVDGEDTALTFRYGEYFKSCAGVSIKGDPEPRVFTKGDTISVWVGVEKSCLNEGSPDFRVSSILTSNVRAEETLEVELSGEWSWHDSSFNTAWGAYFDYVVEDTGFIAFDVATSHGDLRLGMLVKVLNSAPRAFFDSADILSEPKLHAVYVIPADVPDKRRDTRGEIESWVLQAAALAEDRFGASLRLDLDSGGNVDVLYMRSEYTQRELLNTDLEAALLSEVSEEVKARVGVGLENGVIALFIENSSSLPKSDYCGFAELGNFLGDNASSFVVGPLGQCEVPGGDGFDYPASIILHELLHSLGVEHIDVANEAMCGDPFDCATGWDWDSGKIFYNGTTSSHSKIDILSSKIWVKKSPVRPNPPSGFRWERGVGKITLHWDYPKDDGGGIVGSYLAIASPGGARCWAGTGRSCTFNNLEPSTGYTFKVAAFNVFGKSDLSEQTKIAYTAQVPSKPQGVEIKNTSQYTISTVWKSIDGNGSNVSRIESRQALSPGKWSTWKPVSNGSKISNKLWKKGAILRIEIRGINEVGVGQSSSTSVKLSK